MKRTEAGGDGGDVWTNGKGEVRVGWTAGWCRGGGQPHTYIHIHGRMLAYPSLLNHDDPAFFFIYFSHRWPDCSSP